MKRNLRLTRSSDFERVRQNGKSYAHPLLVLIKDPNQNETLRIGISAGRVVGNAVKRNRVKRRMRASLSSIMTNIQPGWDLVFLARKAVNEANFSEILSAEIQLLKRAGLFREESVIENGSSTRVSQ